MKQPGPQAFFLPAASGQRYCLYHEARGVPQGMVLHVHPFAEEMNKTRRMAALQARALAAEGLAVLQIDLFGCGDSSGDFEEADWQTWIDDLLLAHQWLRQALDPHAEPPLWLWGVRAGCLLAADVGRMLDGTYHLLLWQPSFTEGTAQLQQFLRLRLAADMLAVPAAAPQARGAMDELRQQLAQGQTLNVAGYALNAQLALGLQSSRLTPPAPRSAEQRLVWLETSMGPEPALSPLGQRAVAAWHQAGWQTQGLAVPGPAFWQSPEIEEAPHLIAATLVAVQTGRQP